MSAVRIYQHRLSEAISILWRGKNTCRGPGPKWKNLPDKCGGAMWMKRMTLGNAKSPARSCSRECTYVQKDPTGDAIAAELYLDVLNLPGYFLTVTRPKQVKG